MTAVTDIMSAKQISYITDSTARVNIAHGSIRSGKTIASLLRWLIYVADAPRGGELVMVGKTSQTVARNVFAPLTNPEIFGELASQVHYAPGAPAATILGRTVHVIGANDAKAESKIRGFTAAGAYVDEASLVPREFFNQLIGRMSVAGAKLFATTNPDNPAHWLRKEYLSEPSENTRVWHFTLDDNPFLNPEYVAHIKSQYTGLFYRRFVLGEWVQAEGAIYSMWEPTRHVVATLPEMTRLPAAGIDYGTANVFAGLMLGIGSDGVLYLTGEYRHEAKRVGRQLTDAEYAAAVREWMGTTRPDYVVVDPSASSFITELLLGGTTATKGDNAVSDGIRLVSSLLATDRLKVHESCRGFIDEVTGYAWDDAAALKGEDKPIKADDHSLDAARYAIKTTQWLWTPYVLAA